MPAGFPTLPYDQILERIDSSGVLMMDSAMGKKNDALGLLGFVTGLVNQELLLRKNTSWQRTAF
jgi:hypothetical protein